MSDWSDWESCSATCGNGEQQRYRECIGPQNCDGELEQKQNCNIGECPGNYRISLNTSRYFFISRPWLLVERNEIQKEYKSTSNISRWPFKSKYLKVSFSFKAKITFQSEHKWQ